MRSLERSGAFLRTEKMMNISKQNRKRIEALAPVLSKMDEAQIAVEIKDPGSSLRKHLHIAAEGAFSSFYAPFDWVNDQARVIIVGVTPGLVQAEESLIALKRALKAGLSAELAAKQAKQASSFKGPMRRLGARLMDHFGLNDLFGLPSTIQLFSSAASIAHYTSVLRYPVLQHGKNFSGDKRILKRSWMKSMIDGPLAEEMSRLPEAWIVPFGPAAHLALEYLAEKEIVDPERILGGILHPSGKQWNRYNVQFGITTGEAVDAVNGGPEVLRRSNELRNKVSRLLDERPRPI